MVVTGDHRMHHRELEPTGLVQRSMHPLEHLIEQLDVVQRHPGDYDIELTGTGLEVLDVAVLEPHPIISRATPRTVDHPRRAIQPHVRGGTLGRCSQPLRRTHREQPVDIYRPYLPETAGPGATRDSAGRHPGRRSPQRENDKGPATYFFWAFELVAGAGFEPTTFGL